MIKFQLIYYLTISYQYANLFWFCSSSLFLFFFFNLPFKCQSHKEFKHIQTICQQKLTNYLNVFDNFVGLVLKVLRNKYG